MLMNLQINNSYDIFIAYAALLFANMVVGILYLFAGGDSGQTFGLALIYWALYTPLSFICWFRPAYKAFRDDSSFNFMVSKMFMTQRCQAKRWYSAITFRNGCSFISLPFRCFSLSSSSNFWSPPFTHLVLEEWDRVVSLWASEKRALEIQVDLGNSLVCWC